MSVYIIKSPDGKIYVGSTNRSIKKRQDEHRSECFNPNRSSYGCRSYTHFRNCGMTAEDIKCEVIVECNATINLRAMEAKWIKHIGSLNSKSSILDLEKVEARQAKYKEEGGQIQKCECGGSWTYGHSKRHYNTLLHKDWLTEEYQKKIQYLHSLNEAKNTIVKNIPLHYDQTKNCFIKTNEEEE